MNWKEIQGNISNKKQLLFNINRMQNNSQSFSLFNKAMKDEMQLHVHLKSWSSYSRYIPVINDIWICLSVDSRATFLFIFFSIYS